MKSVLLGFVGALAAITVTFIGYAQYGDYRSAAETGEWLVLAAPLKGQVEEAIAKQGGLAGFKVPVPIVTSKGQSLETMILESGAILLRGGSDGQMVVLVPTRTGSSIAWRCIGGSGRAMPSACRTMRQ